jgi:hypothetical protein
MTYFGAYDSAGEYTGFYIVDIHGENIPTLSIELTETEWQEALTGNYRVIDGKHTYSPYIPTDEEIKAQKITALDAEYQPQFYELSQALGITTLSDNTTLITGIKADYLDLKAEYDEKREVITNG